jgi:hypothetical protein
VGCEFEWDREKARANLRKHGVDFDEAATVFSDPLSVLVSDPDHSLDEQRFVVLCVSRQGKLLVVTFAERPHRTRIISARLATSAERRSYEEA